MWKVEGGSQKVWNLFHHICMKPVSYMYECCKLHVWILKTTYQTEDCEE